MIKKLASEMKLNKLNKTEANSTNTQTEQTEMKRKLNWGKLHFEQVKIYHEVTNSETETEQIHKLLQDQYISCYALNT